MIKRLFQWQKGYDVFSISQKNLDRAIEYVKNQKIHRANSTIGNFQPSKREAV